MAAFTIIDRQNVQSALQVFQANVLEPLNPGIATNSSDYPTIRTGSAKRTFEEYGYTQMLSKGVYENLSARVNRALAALQENPPNWAKVQEEIPELQNFAQRLIPAGWTTNSNTILLDNIAQLQGCLELAQNPPKEVAVASSSATPRRVSAPPLPVPQYPQARGRKRPTKAPRVNTNVPSVTGTGQPPGGPSSGTVPRPVEISPEFLVPPIKLFQNSDRLTAISRHFNSLFPDTRSTNIQMTTALQTYFTGKGIDPENKIFGIYEIFTKLQSRITAEQDPHRREALQTHLNSVMNYYRPPTVLSQEMYSAMNDSLYRLLQRVDKLYGTHFVADLDKAGRKSQLATK
ncbi:MAG: hypothetical protein HZA83_02705 [Thaumarchaeota archaeon]|nr:hypothetical protein [Nitrososphaerota archaeon]